MPGSYHALKTFLAYLGAIITVLRIQLSTPLVVDPAKLAQEEDGEDFNFTDVLSDLLSSWEAGAKAKEKAEEGRLAASSPATKLTRKTADKIKQQVTTYSRAMTRRLDGMILDQSHPGHGWVSNKIYAYPSISANLLSSLEAYHLRWNLGEHSYTTLPEKELIYRMGKMPYKSPSHVVGKPYHYRPSDERLDKLLVKLLNEAKSAGKLEATLNLKHD
ncbi:hypothetical protein BDZ45DRAFT_804748 [Acephala macrosclerotiorum]|nr:hypothetical protein BDZ45DRAFT_804748 [Acephala macrosclerotiorum]